MEKTHDGYNQMAYVLAERYDIELDESKKLLNRCLFDYDVIVAVLDRAEELMEEKLYG